MQTKTVLATLLLLLALSISAEPLNLKGSHLLSLDELNYRLPNPERTLPPVTPIRPVAEFERSTGVLIRWPLDFPTSAVVDMAETAQVITIVSSQSVANSVLSTYAAAGVNTDNCSFLIHASDSEWTRDYGPWFAFDSNGQLCVIDFTYNRDRPNDDAMADAYASFAGLNSYDMPVIHTGGNYMTDGVGCAASTELVYEENSLTQAQVNAYMQQYLGVNTYHVITDPLGEYIKHIDCWAKFLDVDKVLVDSVATSDSRFAAYQAAANYFRTHNSAYGTPFQVYRVFAPGSSSRPTPYSNTLILNNKIFLPLSGNSNDDQAIAFYQRVMPGYEIVTLNYSGWYDTDAMHCRSHELADPGMLYIYHAPQRGIFAQSPQLQAYIYPHSGQALIADSLKVYYRVNNGGWLNTLLTAADEHNYTATIPGLQPGDRVDYYLAAADLSGRREMRPFIGAPQAYTFSITPDTLAPELVFTPLTTLPADQLPCTFTCQVTDDNRVNEVAMHYAANPALDFSALDFSGSEDNLWSAEFDLDPHPAAGDSIYYYLTASDPAGNTTRLPQSGYYVLKFTGTAAQDNPTANISLLPPSPNPFNPRTCLAYNLATPASVKLCVYDARGRKVTTLAQGPQTRGLHRVYWNGADQKGHPQASGVYFAVLQTGAKILTQKMLLLK